MIAVTFINNVVPAGKVVCKAASPVASATVIADIKSRLGEGDSEDVEMAEETPEETPEVSDKPKTIKTTEVKEFSAEEELENLKAENEKLKTELAATPADTPINTNKFSSERTTLSNKEYRKLSKQERFLYNLNK